MKVYLLLIGVLASGCGDVMTAPSRVPSWKDTGAPVVKDGPAPVRIVAVCPLPHPIGQCRINDAGIFVDCEGRGEPTICAPR